MTSDDARGYANDVPDPETIPATKGDIARLGARLDEIASLIDPSRIHTYRGWVAALACAIYNGEGWDKQTIAALLHMGDERYDYPFPGEPPEKLTEEDIFAAMDAVFRRAGK